MVMGTVIDDVENAHNFHALGGILICASSVCMA
jgi:hypothetical protein